MPCWKFSLPALLSAETHHTQRVRILTTHTHTQRAEATLSTCRKFVACRKCTFDHSLTKCPSQRINEMQLSTSSTFCFTLPPPAEANINGSNQSGQMDHPLVCGVRVGATNYTIFGNRLLYWKLMWNFFWGFATICMRLRSSSTCWVVSEFRSLEIALLALPAVCSLKGAA